MENNTEKKEFTLDELKQFKEQITTQQETLKSMYEDLLAKLNAIGPCISLIQQQLEMLESQIKEKEKAKA